MYEKDDCNFIKVVKGIEILGFKLGSQITTKLEVNFIIDIKNSSFDINVEEHNVISDSELWRAINLVEKVDYLYCIDENSVPFTLFDCTICPKEVPLKNVMLIWNGMLYGNHIENMNTFPINKMKVLIESKKLTYRISVGKSEYKIDSDTIIVKTDWSKSENRFNGVLFELTSDDMVSFENMIDSFDRLREIYFLYIGYFADVLEMKVSNSSKEMIYINSNSTIYHSVSNSISINKRLLPLDHNDFSKQYEKWSEMRKENIAVFTMFVNAINNQDDYEEVKITKLIQCLDGYFNTHHSDMTDKFDKSIDKKIIDVMIGSLNSSDEINELLIENEIKKDDVINSARGLLGNINKKSMKDILYLALNYTPFTSKVFDYEYITAYSKEKTLLDIFVNMAIKHRNFLSHLNNEKKYFKERKTGRIAKLKLELLIRLIILHDIGLNVEEEQLNNYIKEINKECYE